MDTITQPATKIREAAPFVYDENETPMRRLQADGAKVLSTRELLELVVGGSPQVALECVVSLQAAYPTLRDLANAPFEELATRVHNLGRQSAARLLAVMELSRRYSVQNHEPNPVVRTPAEAAQIWMAEIGIKDQEEVWVMCLDSRNRIISNKMLYRGTVNEVNMRPAEIFREAVRVNAISIIVCHNHPSGDPSPSTEDVQVTKELVKAGKLMQIEVLDHVVVAQNRYVSLKERGLGF